MRSEDDLSGSNYEERSFELLIFVASKVVFAMKVTSLLFSLILYGYNRHYLTLFLSESFIVIFLLRCSLVRLLVLSAPLALAFKMLTAI